MKIIIEGLDRAGKDTLAASLDTNYITSTNVKGWTSAQYTALGIKELKKLKNDNFVRVRFHLSNFVYNMLRGDETIEESLKVFHMFDDALSDCTIYFLDISYDEYLKRSKSKSISQDMFERQRDIFKLALKLTKCKVKRIY